MATDSLFICVVVGPTAAGKTDLAVDLAGRNQGEIVSFDSMQIYRDAPVATAIPTPEERQGIPHHLMGFASCDTSFSVARYTEMAHQVIREIHDRGHLPVLVGGTGLYYSALLDNLQFTDQPSEETAAVRQRLHARLEQEGIEPLYRELTAIDPRAAASIHINNHTRVLRALELHAVTGKTMSAQVADSRRQASPYTPCVIGLTYRDRQLLYDRINRRVEQMLAAGLEEEVRRLYEKQAGGTLMQAIGVKEFLPYLRGEITLSQVVDTIQTETRHYAKRQLTWFRRDERVHWLYREEYAHRQALAQAAQMILDDSRPS